MNAVNLITNFMLRSIIVFLPLIMSNSSGQGRPFGEVEKRIFFNIDVANPNLKLGAFTIVKELHHQEPVPCQRGLSIVLRANGDSSAQLCSHLFAFSTEPVFNEHVDAGAILVDVLSTHTKEAITRIGWKVSFTSEEMAKQYFQKLCDLVKKATTHNKEEYDQERDRYRNTYSTGEGAQEMSRELTISLQKAADNAAYEISVMPGV